MKGALGVQMHAEVEAHLGVVLEERAGLLQCFHPEVACGALDPVRVLSDLGHGAWGLCRACGAQQGSQASLQTITTP